MKRQLVSADDAGQLGSARKRSFNPPLLCKGSQQDTLQEPLNEEKTPLVPELRVPRGTIACPVPAIQARLAFRPPGISKGSPSPGVRGGPGPEEGPASKPQPAGFKSGYVEGKPPAAPGLLSAARPIGVPGLSAAPRSAGLCRRPATPKGSSKTAQATDLFSTAGCLSGKVARPASGPFRSATRPAAAPFPPLAAPAPAKTAVGAQDKAIGASPALAASSAAVPSAALQVGQPEHPLPRREGPPEVHSSVPAERLLELCGSPAAIVGAQDGSGDGLAPAVGSSPAAEPNPADTGEQRNTRATQATASASACRLRISVSDEPPARSSAGSGSPRGQRGIGTAGSDPLRDVGAADTAAAPRREADIVSAAAAAVEAAPSPSPNGSQASAGNDALDEVLPLELPVTLEQVPDVLWPEPPQPRGGDALQVNEGAMAAGSVHLGPARSGPAGTAGAGAGLPGAGVATAMAIRRMEAVALLPPHGPLGCVATGPAFTQFFGGLQVSRLMAPVPAGASAALPGLMDLGGRRALQGQLRPVPVAAGHEACALLRPGAEGSSSPAGAAGSGSGGSGRPFLAEHSVVCMMQVARRNVLRRFIVPSRYSMTPCDMDGRGGSHSGHTGAGAVASCPIGMEPTCCAQKAHDGFSDGPNTGGPCGGDGGTAQAGHRLCCETEVGSSVAYFAAGADDRCLEWSGLSLQFLVDVFS